MELMGLYEIASTAGVTPQAVSNWMMRKPFFPKPMVTLASGPIWDSRVVRAWLKSEGKFSDQSHREGNMERFIKGEEYTHAQIVTTLGGDTVSYLPQSEGRILGGRFKKDNMNPEAPYKIIVGDLPQVRRKAELLANQDGSIPVFLKQGSNRWLFHGNMDCVSYETGVRAMRAALGTAEREEGVAGVLTLRDVK